MSRIKWSSVFGSAPVMVLALVLAGGVSDRASAQRGGHTFGGHAGSFTPSHSSIGSSFIGHGSTFGAHGSSIGSHGSTFFGHGSSFFDHGARFVHHGGSHTSFFFGLSFGYPYYYGYYPYYDPFYYPVYYPIYRPVYVEDRPVYVEPDRRSPGAVHGDDDYYLYRRPSPLKRDQALADAVADIERAFANDDVMLLERHVDSGANILVRSRDRDGKSIKGGEYLDMTRGALHEMKTVSYKLDSVVLVRDGEARVNGVHVLKMENGDERRFDVHFLLKRHDDKWFIAEAGAGGAR